MSTSERPLFRFGPFELLTGPSALHRHGHAVSITPKALATLTALVTRNGTAMSKEDLLATVWADTAVEEANLSQNIYTLRKLLAPDFPEQNPIENIPRFGYRFTLPVEVGRVETATSSAPAPPHVHGLSGSAESIAPVANVEDEAQKVAPSATTDKGRRPGFWKLLWVLPLVLVVLAAVWLYRSHHERPQPVQAATYEARRFTSNSSEDSVTAVALSPDGNHVAYADADGIVLRGTQEVGIHLLPSPHLRVATRLSWFPDQLHLVLSGEDARTGAAQVWKISVLGEPAQLLRSGARLGVASHDGSSVALATQDGSEIWVTGPSGENGRRVTSVETGDRVSTLLWAANDDGLLVERRSDAFMPIGPPVDTPRSALHFRMTYERVDLATGKPTAIRTNFSIGDACLTSNGDLIYSATKPEEGQESISLWRTSLAPSGEIGTDAKKVFEVTDLNYMYAFSCDADGKQIAVLRKEGSISVYVGALGRGGTQLTGVRRLSFDSYVAYPHGWSSDGESVLYEAKRNSSNSVDPYQIHIHALNRHDPEPIVTMNGSQARPVLTPDHHWLLFVNQQPFPFGQRTVYRVPPKGGTPEAVPAGEDLSDYRCPARGGTCIVRTSVAGGQATYCVLDPMSGRGKALFQEPMNWNPPEDWDVSPDGATLVTSTPSQPAPLHKVSLATGAIEDVPYHPVIRSSAVNWAYDGKGWFVSNATPSGTALSYVDLAGGSTFLRMMTTPTWAVPSPNGSFVAFVDRNLDGNVWLLQSR